MSSKDEGDGIFNTERQKEVAMQIYFIINWLLVVIYVYIALCYE